MQEGGRCAVSSVQAAPPTPSTNHPTNHRKKGSKGGLAHLLFRMSPMFQDRSPSIRPWAMVKQVSRSAPACVCEGGASV